MSHRKHPNPNLDEEHDLHRTERPERPDPDTLEGPGSRHEVADDEDDKDSTLRRGER